MREFLLKLVIAINHSGYPQYFHDGLFYVLEGIGIELKQRAFNQPFIVYSSCLVDQQVRIFLQ
jgi:hypothetical protein